MLIYLEYSNDEDNDPPPGQRQGPHESLRIPPYVDTTSEPVPPKEKPTKEPTSEHKYDALSNP